MQIGTDRKGNLIKGTTEYRRGNNKQVHNTNTKLMNVHCTVGTMKMQEQDKIPKLRNKRKSG